jgi:hypothetical protein
LFVAQAVHTANITVDEWGTETAAVTAGMARFAFKAPQQLVSMSEIIATMCRCFGELARRRRSEGRSRVGSW